MTKRQMKDGETTLQGFGNSSDMMQYNLELATNMFKPWIAANAAFLNWNASNCRSMSKVYSQWFEFIGDRLEKDAALAEQLQTEKDPENFSKVYTKFFETAAKDYQDEASQLGKLTTTMAQNASDSLQDVNANRAVMGE